MPCFPSLFLDNFSSFWSLSTSSIPPLKRKAIKLSFKHFKIKINLIVDNQESTKI